MAMTMASRRRVEGCGYVFSSKGERDLEFYWRDRRDDGVGVVGLLVGWLVGCLFSCFDCLVALSRETEVRVVRAGERERGWLGRGFMEQKQREIAC
ncbi:uncharacterized protein K452DRAFT_137280 [Aplosporella prunicola CBS 121167]|uniref:Uncharacterized protein n=1 Tax=Aplosporella prunicola CBS 121167 TaxID=1176127 RepID=A0A6A6BNL9_9PEZI|nr:uncharacterized protein K452DRAFT_137280 [Aplosporella prunicola CBS 121167]KAF2145268.1 hypothetical protein K452DRAFT_137280 [Aplosporella prunicola CBS 121167]